MQSNIRPEETHSPELNRGEREVLDDRANTSLADTEPDGYNWS